MENSKTKQILTTAPGLLLTMPDHSAARDRLLVALREKAISWSEYEEKLDEIDEKEKGTVNTYGDAQGLDDGDILLEGDSADDVGAVEVAATADKIKKSKEKGSLTEGTLAARASTAGGSGSSAGDRPPRIQLPPPKGKGAKPASSSSSDDDSDDSDDSSSSSSSESGLDGDPPKKKRRTR